MPDVPSSGMKKIYTILSEPEAQHTEENCGNNSYFKTKKRQRQTIGRFSLCVFDEKGEWERHSP
jgi:hypothetical protein